MFGFALTNCSEAAASLQSNPEVSFPRLLEAGKILCFQAGLLLEKNAHQDLLNRKNCLSQPSGGGEQHRELTCRNSAPEQRNRIILEFTAP